MTGRYYGNFYTGMGYSPDRSRDVNHNNLKSQFLGACGSRQGGYYHSETPIYSKPKTAGWYDGAGRYHKE